MFDSTEALFVADFAKRAIISQRPALVSSAIGGAHVHMMRFIAICIERNTGSPAVLFWYSRREGGGCAV